MSAPLQWVFELLDRVSAPAAKIEKAVGGVEDKIKQAGDSHAKAEGHVGRFFERMRHGLETVYFGKEVLHSLAEKVRDLGSELIHAMGDKQHNVLGLKALLGNSEEAEKAFEHIEAAAFRAGKPVDQVIGRFKDLLTAGFDMSEIDTIRKGLGDLAVIDPEKANALGDAIADIGRNGMMTSRQLMQLRHILPMEELRKQLGVSADGMNKLLDGSKAIEAGKAVSALLKVVRDKFSDGVLGSVAKKDAQTLPRLIDRVKMIPEALADALFGVKEIGESPVEKILTNLLAAVDPEGPSGKRIIADLKSLMNAIADAMGISSGSGGFLEELSGPNGVAKIEAIFHRVIGWTKDVALPALQATAKTLGVIVETIARAANVVALLRSGSDDYDPMSVLHNVDSARQTMADPNASEASKIWASDVIRGSYSRPAAAGSVPMSPVPAPAIHIAGSVVFNGVKGTDDASFLLTNWLEGVAVQAGGGK